jgi:hypothetical protein
MDSRVGDDRPLQTNQKLRKLLSKHRTLQRRDDVAYMYYRSLKTLKAPADLIKFHGSLTGGMPEKRGATIWERVVQGPI